MCLIPLLVCPLSILETTESILCATMLQQVIIKPSNSTFSAPVVLVHKQDGSWRFNVDYTALNIHTVKDKFPIPIVLELIDELHAACFFTTLDLRAGYHHIRAPDRAIRSQLRSDQ